MQQATKQLSRAGAERWLYRTERGDYGPVTTDKIFDAIRERKIDLSTQVSVLGSNRWSHAGEFPLFREHYAACQRRWEEERLHAEAEAVGRKIERQGHTSRRLSVLVVLGLTVVLGFMAWGAWRLFKAEPLGLTRIVKASTLPALPAPPPLTRAAPVPPDVPEKKVARLSEPESYDTAGIGIDDGGGAPVVSKLTFDESGEALQAESISAAELSRVVESARQGLYGCAREAAARSDSFAGTEVGFTVSSGRLVKITVGTDARGNAPFQACVKAALAKVAVPAFGGNERRVTVPLRFQ